MSGDYTRFTFAARKLFSGVLKQQGRVSLDADFNEFQEILDRRDRSEMYDTVGHAVVPKTTPHGFEIGVYLNSLIIGVGRMYVDGIQAECFGRLRKPLPPQPPPPTEFDPALGNLIGSSPLPFTAQPFYYNPNFPGLTGSGITHMVYLDVWQREVTSWEDDRLLDKALGGVDTDTRVQTAWQVKALPNVAADACTNPPKVWKDLIAPSSARMTAAASAVPLPPGPCVIQPAGGYTGLENRLYRVEVDAAGTLAGAGGTPVATFKWSRDNASLVASVLGINPVAGGSVIDVESIGRDSWTRLKVDDHIELLDDYVEFAMRDSGASGQIAKVTNVNVATQQITIDQNFSAFTVLVDRHPRIRRWDTEKPGDPAVRPVQNGVAIALENGISISFGDATPAHAGDTLHAGDYWVFAARTADGSIEEVDNEFPRGILHHFAPLAIVTSGNPPKVNSDCRDFWPLPCDCQGDGGCECDACVTVESHTSGALTVQAAVKQVITAGGGTVCIGIGLFNLGDQWIEISDAVSVHVRGRGLKTVLEYNGTGAAIRIGNAVDISVRDLSLLTERRGASAMNAIEVETAALVMLERLNVVEDPLGVLAFLDQAPLNRPIGSAIALAGFLLGTAVRDCNLAGGGGVASRSSVSGEPNDYLVSADLDIRRNLVLAVFAGIVLGVSGRGQPVTVLLAADTAVMQNTVLGCTGAGIALGAEVFAGQVGVSANVCGTLGDGIQTATNRSTVSDNVLIAVGSRQEINGISVMRGRRSVVSDAWLRGNRIDGYGGVGISVDANAIDLLVEANTIATCGHGIVMTESSKGQAVRIVGNRISDIGKPAENANRPIYGIALVFTDGAEVIDNTIVRVATGELKAIWRAGIQLIACLSARVHGNTINDIGSSEEGLSVGIGATLGYGRLDVLDNNVSPIETKDSFAWYALLIGEGKELWAGKLVQLGQTLWWVDPASAFKLTSRDAPTETAVRGNHLLASGGTPTAEVQTFGSCTFAENWCTGLLEANTPVVKLGDVELRLRALALANNHVRHPSTDGVTVEAWVDEDAREPKPNSPATTVLGNVTVGHIAVDGSLLGSPWRSLNVVIP
jgi:hypothetical protein